MFSDEDPVGEKEKPESVANPTTVDEELHDIPAAIQELRELHKAARYIPAARLADRIAAAVAAMARKPGGHVYHEWHASRELQRVVAESRSRAAKVEAAMATGFDGAEEDGWTLAKESAASR